MKKIILTIAIALAAAFSANAQLRIEGALTLGNYEKPDGFSSIVSQGFDPAASFAARAFYDYNLNVNGLDGLMLSAGAGVLSNTIADKNNSSKFNTTWIQVPVTVGEYYQFGAGALYAAVGLYYGYCISGKVYNSTVSIDAKDGLIKSNDFGYIAQVGYALPMNLGIYCGYTNSLINIADLGGSGNMRNKVFEIGLFYKF